MLRLAAAVVRRGAAGECRWLASRASDPAADTSPDPLVAERLAVWDALVLQQTPAAAASPGMCDVVVCSGTDTQTVSVASSATIQDAIKLAEATPQDADTRLVAARVDGQLVDLARQLGDIAAPAPGAPVNVQALWMPSHDSLDACSVYWHSAAHVLGAAIEQHVPGALLDDGPALPEQGGFFYDVMLPESADVLTPADLPRITKRMQRLVRAREPFQRLVVSREHAKQLFAANTLKLERIKRLPDDAELTVYRSGSLIDLCRGPHVPDTGVFRAIELLDVVDITPPDSPAIVQRVYGIAFPSKKQLKDWKTWREEARRRDHRIIGKAQDLWTFHPSSPGSAFFLPHGMHVYNTLVDMLRREYRLRGYQEVQTPNVFHQSVWETSGHWQHYRDDMYLVVPGDASPEERGAPTVGLKPMNCPAHCLLFQSSDRSYRTLPLRYAEFGVLHRNEVSGALSGLTRVRRFQQDDAHIFCLADQVEDEIFNVLTFVRDVYTRLGFTLTLGLSTRPASYVGELDQWDASESALAAALDRFGLAWHTNPGDGAFYGPKIDVLLRDTLNRQHQCGTIQLDFNLPQRFDLHVRMADGSSQRPVMIHRAVYGSIERMLAVLTEHYAGHWPFWLSPRQVAVCPISTERHGEYAGRVTRLLHDAGYQVELMDRAVPLQKRLANAQRASFNCSLVIGDEEQAAECVNVRLRDGMVMGPRSLQDTLAWFADLTQGYALDMTEG